MAQDEERYRQLMVKLSMGTLTHDEQIELYNIVIVPPTQG